MSAYEQQPLSVRAMHIRHAYIVLRIALVIDTPKSGWERTCSSRSVFAQSVLRELGMSADHARKNTAAMHKIVWFTPHHQLLVGHGTVAAVQWNDST